MGMTYGLLDENNAEVQRRAARAGGWTDAHALAGRWSQARCNVAPTVAAAPPPPPAQSWCYLRLRGRPLHNPPARWTALIKTHRSSSMHVALRNCRERECVASYTNYFIQLFHSIGPAVEVELSSRERSARGRTMRVCRQDGERAAGRIGPCGAGTTAALHCPPRHARYYFALRYCRPLSKASARPSWCGHGLILLAVPVGGTGIGRWRALRCVTRLLPLGRWDSVPSAIMSMAAC